MAREKLRFRPMQLGDIFDETFDLYKRNFVLLAGIAAVIYLPLVFGMNLMQVYAALKVGQPVPTTGTGMPDLAPMFAQLAFVGAYLAIFALLTPIISGTFTFAVSKRLLGEQTSVGGSYKFILKRVVVVFGTLLMSWLAANAMVLVIGAVACATATSSPVVAVVVLVLLLMPAVLVSIVVSIRLMFTAAAVVLEGRGYVDALNRSWQLTAGHFWRLLGITLLIGLIVSLVAGVIDSPLSMAILFTTKQGAVSPLVPVNAAVSAIIQSALAPITFIVSVLLYYDVRIRKEGFDLQMLARDLAVASGQPVPDIVYPDPPVDNEPTVYGDYVIMGGPGKAPLPLDEVPEGACHFCRFDIGSPDKAVTCEQCGHVFHKECWDEKGGCRTPGCPANPSSSGHLA